MDSKQTERNYTINASLLQAVYNYLASKPYNDVALIINPLTALIDNQNKEAEALVPQEKEENNEKTADQ